MADMNLDGFENIPTNWSIIDVEIYIGSDNDDL